MGHYNLSLSLDAKIMVSTNCPIISNSVQGWWFSLLSFVWSGGEGGGKVTTILRRWSSRGLGTLEVMTVPALTGNIMPSSSLEGKQLPDRPEPGQIARDRSLKKINSKYETRGASDMKKVPLHYRINRFSGQHLTLNDWSRGEQWISFPEDLNVSRDEATTSGHLWSRTTAANISLVTVNYFLFDVIVFAMLPAHGIWRETVSLLDIMWPWTSQWMARGSGENASYITILNADLKTDWCDHVMGLM